MVKIATFVKLKTVIEQLKRKLNYLKMKNRNKFSYASTWDILTLKGVGKIFLYILLFNVLTSNAQAQNWSVKILVNSDQYLVSNFVNFDLLVTAKNTEHESWEKLKKQPIKEVIGVLKTTFDGPPRVSFQTNNGYVEHNDLLFNTWYFNRDSAMQLNKGLLKLKVSYFRSDSIVFDSIQIVLPQQIIKIVPYWGDKRSDYFNNIFETGIIVYFDDGRSSHASPYFYNNQTESINQSILKDIIVKGDVYFKEGKCKVNYDNPQDTKQVTFVNRKTNKIINTVNIPKSIYINRESIWIKPIQVSIKSIDGKDGNIYRIDSIIKTSFFQIDREGNRIDSQTLYKLNDIDLALINGENGVNGANGINGKPIVVKIDRTNQIDSIAKITVLVDETTYVYFIDIINGGTLEINNIGGNGTNGSRGEKCGYIENIDVVLFWGIAGIGGVGGNGGDGGAVTIYADNIYKKYIANIDITNEGGEKGYGGVNALQITHDFAPNAGYYYNTKPGLYMTGKFRLKTTEIWTDYASPKFIINKMPKTYSPIIDGKPGKNGQVIYNFY